MRVVVQRVTQASVSVDNEITGQIEDGLLLLVGFKADDDTSVMQKVAQKIVNLRIFGDAEGKMNLSVLDIGGNILSISQFTLYADVKKGNRPSFTHAAPGQQAAKLYAQFLEILSAALGKPVENGIFGAHMLVQLQNDGPVTIIIDSENL
jgi:D-tyrosyl-tRNA(Tyr) deacylase